MNAIHTVESFDTIEAIEAYFEQCRQYWLRNGDMEAVAFAKAFYWDCIEIWTYARKEWTSAMEKFAMDTRGYRKGDPLPPPERVEHGGV